MADAKSPVTQSVNRGSSSLVICAQPSRALVRGFSLVVGQLVGLAIGDQFCSSSTGQAVPSLRGLRAFSGGVMAPPLAVDPATFGTGCNRGLHRRNITMSAHCARPDDAQLTVTNVTLQCCRCAARCQELRGAMSRAVQSRRMLEWSTRIIDAGAHQFRMSASRISQSETHLNCTWRSSRIVKGVCSSSARLRRLRCSADVCCSADVSHCSSYVADLYDLEPRWARPVCLIGESWASSAIIGACGSRAKRRRYLEP